MHDVIIIGKGPAGMSAALYTVRANLKTLIVGRNDSRLLKADRIDNYFGFSKTISGAELLKEGEAQVLRLGAEIAEEEVMSLGRDGPFIVETEKRKYEAKALLLATGQPQNPVKVENLAAFEGRGISYCVTCDGFFYNNLKVGVLGFKDYAVHEAIELLNYTKDITIYTNGQPPELSEKYQDEVVRFNVNVKQIKKLEGGESLQRVHFADGTSEELEGLFVAYESASSTDFARKLGILTEGTAVTVDGRQRTNIEGLFAAGDCTGGLKQISTAVGQGAVAGKAMVDYVKHGS